MRSLSFIAFVVKTWALWWRAYHVSRCDLGLQAVAL